ERLRHVRWQDGDGDGRAPLLEQLRDEPAVVAEDARGLLGLPDVDLGDGRAVAAHGVPAPQAESGEEGEQHHQAEADAGDETGACPQPVEDGARATTELTHRYPPWKIRSSPSWSGRRGGETRRRSYTVPRAGV